MHMKKRTISMIMAIVLMFSLTACSGNVNSTVSPPASTRPAPVDRGDDAMTVSADTLGITAENYPLIDGSTSTLCIAEAIYRAMFGEDSYGDEAYPNKASKTVPSYHLLIDKKVDMILVPYASAEILKDAAKVEVELEFHKVAAEALVFITPAENPTDSITREQVRDIYLNYGITNWNRLGGPDRELVPICRNSDSGSQSQMDNLILNDEKMHPRIQQNYVELTMEGMLEQVAFYHSGGIGGKPTNSYALGYTLYTYLHSMDGITGIGERLKILAFDGTMPTVENIADGSYSLSDGYYAVVCSDLPQDHKARSIIKWLQGTEGAAAIEKVGLISIGG